MSTYPLWAWVIGVILLGGILAYGIIRTGRLTPREKQISEAGTERLKDKESK
jgi:hypothetical protein